MLSSISKNDISQIARYLSGYFFSLSTVYFNSSLNVATAFIFYCQINPTCLLSTNKVFSNITDVVPLKRSRPCCNSQHISARLHSGKFSSDKKISFVLNLLVVHGSSHKTMKNYPSKQNFPDCKPASTYIEHFGVRELFKSK